MARKTKAQPVPARMLAIVRDPLYKKWGAALRAYERAVDKRSRDEIELSTVQKARDKALDAYNWLRALSLTPDELEQEYARLRAINEQLAAAEGGARAARHAARQAELDALDRIERDEPHTRYVPGLGYVRGKRVVSQ